MLPARRPRRRSRSRACARSSDAGAAAAAPAGARGLPRRMARKPRSCLGQYDSWSSGSGLGQHTIVADHGRLELLRLVEAALLAAAAKRVERFEIGNDLPAILDQVTESSVAQAQHQIADLGRRLGLQLAEDAFHKALIFIDFVSLGTVADESARHGYGLSDCCTGSETSGDPQRIRTPRKIIAGPAPHPPRRPLRHSRSAPALSRAGVTQPPRRH